MLDATASSLGDPIAMSMTAHRLLCLGPHGFYQLAYTRWTPCRAGGSPVVCVHGLTRNGRDFDVLAERLAGQRLVVAPDMPGRGRSDFLPVKTDYGYPLYLSAVAALIGSLEAETIDYVGTSMGGIIGMMLACQPNSPIRRLVLNDVGPLIPKTALERICTYVGQGEEFDDLDAVEAYFRRVSAPFGRLTDAQWRHMAEHGYRRLDTGKLALAYDPQIALPFRGEQADVDLWPVYDQIRCPTLVIRGGQSDLLLAETAAEMTRRGPKAALFEVAEAGHAPALMAGDQVAVIERFLLEGAAS
jgi:pimeloyl-ACP methyl ester carboxylesterase